MNAESPINPQDREITTPDQARRLLTAIPERPRREFTIADHASTAVTVAGSFFSGLVALIGHPWWAIIPTLCTLITSHYWIASRLARPNEPRLKVTAVSAAFTVWLLIPVWRGISHGETIPFPEAFLFAGLAPAAWLTFYIILLIRR
ncbi:hypothetical protein OL239_05315 [Arthrobacter sp. ATA002]|uniref:hypothetical protein n=1 Tax=Arthrobacter sp. ATA002 TaxID=2991715 RepID=UPI0022A7D99C|nr:hypothetical protein [Arthrobacter sp. ATA002]WAP52643.1 hypothetical protein OL239_05315 [Arthrobacter sp. ATA002]